MEKVADESRPRIFAYDDVSGAPLEVDRVKKARAEEIKYFMKMGGVQKGFESTMLSTHWTGSHRSPVG